jgi:glyoxylase-like metal-dependent hydrolase (beta-lactamase superfamily II)
VPNTTFSSEAIHYDTWLIQGDGSNSYLLVGNMYGLVIDTGFAIENIQKYAQSLTDKPVTMAANTHGHFDHTGGNGWFSRTYMSAKALEIAKTPYPSKNALPYPLDYPVSIVGDGDAIDLGGRRLEVIEIPAHAPSSIAFLDREERILFTGDEVADGVMLVWMQDEPQPTIEQHAWNMEKLLKFRDAYDYICGGHSNVMDDPSLIEVYLEHDRRIMTGMQGGPWVPKGNYPAGFHMPQPEFKRVSEYKGTRIGYDSRYIFDEVGVKAS